MSRYPNPDTNRSRLESLRPGALALALTAASAAGPSVLAQDAGALELGQFPSTFVPPPLHPEGAELTTRELAPGVYALVSTRPPVDNAGFIVGDRDVLVIDSHINGDMARKIIAAVRDVTDKPIRYLVNTNYHGDHTFGNYAFPAETLILAHRETAEHMRSFEKEKAFLLATVERDPTIFAEVELRLPDLVFDDFLRIDLGGRVVELHHFGQGNTKGDTVVYVPEARAAWTGNLIVGGLIPPIFEGRADLYLRTITRFANALDVEAIVPGHGPLVGPEAFGNYMQYLTELQTSVRKSIEAGLSLEEALVANNLPERYLPPADSPLGTLRPLLEGFHSVGVQRTYVELTAKARE